VTPRDGGRRLSTTEGSVQKDYLERVYAGVLGKIIGVYLGRPFEGWSYERLTSNFGAVWYYVHDRLGKPLIVTDDDISGTFTFLRALEDNGYPAKLLSRDIGRSWLNYLIDGRTVLWWGGMGNSTEHTAYLRLARGIEAPRSGSEELNGKVVAEQIGAQIFVDGWAMVCPGDPERAAALAEEAARVSHDGEAVYGARVIAAMEALAFVESDRSRLLDDACRLIPSDSVIARLIADLREWRAAEPDWREARKRLEARYGYDRYGGNCHMVPNHGLIILALLYGDDDFQKSQMIVNTSGWDTDCNAGNLGCLMGIKNGLAGLEAGPDWRGPVADRIYMPTADGGRCITDAATEAVHIANAGRALAGLGALHPKGGARYHFELEGSVQGFRVESPSRETVSLENVSGHSRSGSRSLAIRYSHLAVARPARAGVATFIPEESADPATAGGYGLLASPTLFTGQALRVRLEHDAGSDREVECALYLRSYRPQSPGVDATLLSRGPARRLPPGGSAVISWTVPDYEGQPIVEVGVELCGEGGSRGVVYLDELHWEGTPSVTLGRPQGGGAMWRRAWVDGADHFQITEEPYRLIQDRGRGLVMQGTRQWRDYRVEAEVTPHLAEAAGIAARVQGMRRYYALLVTRNGSLRLVRVIHDETVLAEAARGFELGERHRLALELRGEQIAAFLDGGELFRVTDPGSPLRGGAVGLVCEEGRMASGAVTVSPCRA
jgi:ADP-ribosylglycohydrolase